jgi:hypothetical protein
VRRIEQERAVVNRSERLLEEIVTPLLSSSIITLVSAVGLCLEPGENNQRRGGSEPCLLKPYSILFATRQTNKFMRLPE